MSLLEVVPPVPATGFFTWAWLLIAIPALSAAVLLLVGRAGDRWCQILGAPSHWHLAMPGYFPRRISSRSQGTCPAAIRTGSRSVDGIEADC